MREPSISASPSGWTAGPATIRWEVAVYWPGEGYGQMRILDDEAAALAERDGLLANGYDEVHVRRIVTERFVVVPSPTSRPAPAPAG